GVGLGRVVALAGRALFGGGAFNPPRARRRRDHEVAPRSETWRRIATPSLRSASMPNDPRRRSLRLPGYDYSQAGAYFITACTQNRIMVFGEVIDCDVRLNDMGAVVQQTWDDLPAHYHGLIWTPSLSCPTT